MQLFAADAAIDRLRERVRCERTGGNNGHTVLRQRADLGFNNRDVRVIPDLIGDVRRKAGSVHGKRAARRNGGGVCRLDHQ